MYSKFENLPTEKKQRIIEACIAEFSQNSYVNASTNRIVKKAGISKGIIFHYFGSKKNLFLYIFDYIINDFMVLLNQMTANASPDIFERIMEIGLAKLKLIYEYPLKYRVLINAIHVPADLQPEIQVRYEKIYQAMLPLLFNNVDTSKFRKDINAEKAIEFVFIALEGLGNKYLRTFKEMTAAEIFARLENLTKEYYEFIEILKSGIYGKSETDT